MARIALFLIVATFAMPALAAWETPGTTSDQAGTTPALTTMASDRAYFKITKDDVAKAVAEQLQLQAVEPKAEVDVNAGTPHVLYSADHALRLTIHALQIDTQSKRWQAQAYILAGGKTESVKPVSGVYEGLREVPVLTRQLGRSDVIEANDLTTKWVPERLLRKETAMDVKSLIGQSPRANISVGRPIRLSEVSAPLVIKKGDPVQLSYTNQYMTLRTSGIALQDGARGELIRVKNDKSEKAVSGRVEAAGRVEVNNASTM